MATARGFATYKFAVCRVLHRIHFRTRGFSTYTIYVYGICEFATCMFSPSIRINSLKGYLDE